MTFKGAPGFQSPGTGNDIVVESTDSTVEVTQPATGTYDLSVVVESTDSSVGVTQPAPGAHNVKVSFVSLDGSISHGLVGAGVHDLIAARAGLHYLLVSGSVNVPAGTTDVGHVIPLASGHADATVGVITGGDTITFAEAGHYALNLVTGASMVPADWGTDIYAFFNAGTPYHGSATMVRVPWLANLGSVLNATVTGYFFAGQTTTISYGAKAPAGRALLVSADLYVVKLPLS